MMTDKIKSTDFIQYVHVVTKRLKLAKKKISLLIQSDSF